MISHAVLPPPEVLEEMAARNRKHVERADESYQDLGTVKIFNVGPVKHIISLGGLGIFSVPFIPEGSSRIYSEPLEIWKLYPEGYNVDMNKMKEDLVNGWAIAEAVVGYGKFMSTTSDMRKFGIFTCGAFSKVQASAGDIQKILTSEVKGYLKAIKGSRVINDREASKAAVAAARKNGDRRTDKEIADDILAANLPTAEEIDDATSRLNQYCSELVEEANDYYRNNDLKEIQKVHRWAAIRTNNLDLPWVKTSLIMAKCQVCGNQLLPDVAVCMGCKSVVPGKEEIVKMRRVPGYSYLWENEDVKNKPTAGK